MTTTFRPQSDGISIIDKAPTAVLRYTEDWANASVGSWLAAGETIVSATWTVGAGLTTVSQSNTGTTAAIVLSGGTVGTVYLVSCTITSSADNTDTRSFRVNCIAR
jgi:broad specificity phosphatase PhoE